MSKKETLVEAVAGDKFRAVCESWGFRGNKLWVKDEEFTATEGEKVPKHFELIGGPSFEKSKKPPKDELTPEQLLAKQIDGKYNKDTLVEKAKALELTFEENIKKPDLISLIVQSGKSDEFLKEDQ